MLRSIARRVYRSRNLLVNIFYPLGPLACFLLVVGVTLQVVTSPEGSWWRTCTLSTIAWNLSLHVPGFHRLPIDVRFAILASCVGALFFLLLAVVQRFLLRGLLQYKGWLYVPHGHMPTHVRVWGYLVRLLRGQQPLLYSFRGSLPRQPVPSVAATCERYLHSVAPLYTPEKLMHTQELIERFKKQSWKWQLLLCIKSWWEKNYITDWWEQFVYLRNRSSLMINSNYYVCDSAFKTPTHLPLARAASVAVEMMAYQRLLYHEQLEPMFLNDTTPICMAQFRRMFHSTRIPGRETDEVVHMDPPSKHIVVVYKGVYFALSMYNRAEAPLSKPEMERRLEALVAAVDAGEFPVGEKEKEVAAFTAWERTRWAEAREMYFSEGINRASLEAVEDAAFVMVLETKPAGKEEWSRWARIFFHGNGTDRWVDKSLNFIVCSDAVVGLQAEHTWGDALVVAHMWEWALSKDRVGSYGRDGHTVGYDGAPREMTPTPGGTMRRFGMRWLRWEVLSGGAQRCLREAKEHAEALIADLDLVVERSAFGKRFIKRCGVSPDAFVQMAMCLAYRRARGTYALTYEACTMRLFRHGRTETVRPVTADAVAFAQAMLDGKRVPTAQKITLLRRASDTHTKMYRDAMCGKGVDRHLFALFVASMWYGEESEFLKDAMSQEWMLSTSQQPQTQTKLFDPSHNDFDAGYISPGGGFGPVADAGYGVSYMLAGEDLIFFHISSKRSNPQTDSAQFGQDILRAMEEIASLFPDLERT